MLATEISSAAGVIKAGQNGDMLNSKDRSSWPAELLQLCKHRPKPEPLMHFPSTQPSFSEHLKQLHRSLSL
jgi:hypothetical protein